MIAIEISHLSAQSMFAHLCSLSRQYDEAVKTRPAGPGEPPCVLMVGNSLLLQGVKVGSLAGADFRQYAYLSVFLEATGYYDWLYGCGGCSVKGQGRRWCVRVGVTTFSRTVCARIMLHVVL